MSILKYFAQKSKDGYPVPGTMMGYKAAPKSTLRVEIQPKNYDVLPGQTHVKPSSGLRYFVRKNKAGHILPNSLFTAIKKPAGPLYEFRIVTGTAIIAPVGLTYSTAPATLQINEAMTSISPTLATAGTGTKVYTASGLPTGLSINSSTGVISGTPTIVAGEATFTITVTNEAGSASYAWVLAIIDVIP